MIGFGKFEECPLCLTESSIKTKKERCQGTLKVDKFIEDVCLSKLIEYRYHCHHMKILNSTNAVAWREEAFKNNRNAISFPVIMQKHLR